MPRDAADIQEEIDQLETYLKSADSLAQSVGSDGTTISRTVRRDLERRLDRLYAQLQRATDGGSMVGARVKHR